MASGLLLVILGGSLFTLNLAVSDSDGYTMSDEFPVRSETGCYFLAFLPDRSSTFHLDRHWVIVPEGGKDLFIGWLWFHDIDNVITNRSYETPPYWNRVYNVISQKIHIPQGVVYNEGLSGPAPSGNETFWFWTREAAQGERTEIDLDLEWEPREVKRTLVVMNLDGSEGVSADLRYGTRVPIMWIVPPPLLAGGVLLMAVGVALNRRSGKISPVATDQG